MFSGEQSILFRRNTTRIRSLPIRFACVHTFFEKRIELLVVIYAQEGGRTRLQRVQFLRVIRDGSCEEGGKNVYPKRESSTTVCGDASNT